MSPVFTVMLTETEFTGYTLVEDGRFLDATAEGWQTTWTWLSPVFSVTLTEAELTGYSLVEEQVIWTTTASLTRLQKSDK